LLKHFSWGSIFFVNVPVIIVAIIAGKFLLPSSRDPEAPRLDLVGAGLSIAGLVALLWAIIEAPARGWSDSAVVASLLAGLLILAGFVTWELRSSHPMLDVRFFKNRRFTAANIAITLVFFAMFGQMFLGTQYLQTVLGYSALEAGLRMMPMALVMVALAPVAPRLVERVGTKLVVGTGLLVVVGGLLVVATVPVTNGYPHLLVGFCLVSTGMALVMAPATESIMGSLPPSKAGVGSAMNDTTRQMGGALGVAVLGSIFATVFRPGLTKGAVEAGLTPSQLARAKDSLGGALEVASELPARTAAQLSAVAKTEFVNGLQAAVLVAAAVVVVAAIVVFAYLPARAHDAREAIQREPSDDVLDGLASLTYAEAEGVLEADAANALALDGANEVGAGAPVPTRGSVVAEAGAK
jgi:EmrB/QacA subfamily drug resistance transporter